MKRVKSITLSNFKRFKSFEVSFDEGLNIFLGDNEAGKSSLLLAMDLVLSGSRSRIETIGLESLFNKEVILSFLAGAKALTDLPVMCVELFLSEQNDPYYNGKNNSKDQSCDGIRLTCKAADGYLKFINEILAEENPDFPFEYYEITFATFAAESYSSFKRPIKHLVIDSSQINNEYATREYTKSVYSAQSTPQERHKNQYLYRQSKTAFRDVALSELNAKLDLYKFGVRSDPKSHLETDLVITEGEIPIDRKGKGRQCFIKTEFALRNKYNLDLLLLEEPENHLSHGNMKLLIERISASEEKQLFIATHNSLICSRLDLRKAILLGLGGNGPATLKNLTETTAKFFIKAPDHNILEFVLSKKVILVEGDAEFLLFQALYKLCSGGKSLDADGVHLLSVGGTSFRRYLELSKLLNIKTAVIRDNDGDYQKNCVESYADYAAGHVGIFAEENPELKTFEICFYRENKAICDELFASARTKLSVEEYMLKNKTDSAFALLDKMAARFIAPAYIQRAVEWIRK